MRQQPLSLATARAHFQAEVASTPPLTPLWGGIEPLCIAACGDPYKSVTSPPQRTQLTGICCGWTLPQKRWMLALCKIRSRSSRVTKCIAALSRCWFYHLQISRLFFQKVRSKNQSAKWIWLRCSQTMAPVPWLRNTRGACITLLGSEATAQLICNYSTSWWPKTLCRVIWASASQPSIAVAVKKSGCPEYPNFL